MHKNLPINDVLSLFKINLSFLKIGKAKVFYSQKVHQSCCSTHGTKEHKPASLIKNTHVKTISKVPCLSTNKNKGSNQPMNQYSVFYRETERMHLTPHYLGAFEYIFTLVQNQAAKVQIKSTNTYQMSDPIKCMVAEWPSQDSFATENDHGWDFQSLYQVQIMLKVFRQCQGSKSKGGSN